MRGGCAHTLPAHALQLAVRALSVPHGGARGADKAQSIKVPLDGLKTAAELISSAVDYGAEEVDPEMSVENVQVVYVDSGSTDDSVVLTASFVICVVSGCGSLSPVCGTGCAVGDIRTS